MKAVDKFEYVEVTNFQPTQRGGLDKPLQGR